jgi:hypothetical protein
MLYLAFVRAKAAAAGTEVQTLSRQWWNEGARPEGVTTIAIYGSVGTSCPDVFVFDAATHDDIERVVQHWSPVADLDVHPAVDLADRFRQQGMNIA